MMHFPPLFQISPYFRKIFRLYKIFSILPFPEKFLDFHLPKFLITFFSSTTNFEFPSYFPCFCTFPPCFEKILFPSLLFTISPFCFRKIHLLFTYFLCMSFPTYFDHDAFMHHTMHVLDAPAGKL